MQKLIRFDWAIKKLLRSKAQFAILEGFLSELLSEDIKIKKVLESESNQENHNDKFNRVDLLVENSREELIIIEVQNNREWDFISRLLYGTSKLITEHMKVGMPYSQIKKIICVSIVYFDLGQGKDYIYVGNTKFLGLHEKDELKLGQEEQKLYKDKNSVEEIYPEYYIIKVNQFDEVAKDPLDEWVYFLKTEKIKQNVTARGLKQAKKELDVLKLTETERAQYKRYLESLSYEASTLGHERTLGREEGRAKGLEEGLDKGLEKGRAEGREEEKIAMARRLKIMGMTDEQIMKVTGLSERVDLFDD